MLTYGLGTVDAPPLEFIILSASSIAILTLFLAIEFSFLYLLHKQTRGEKIGKILSLVLVSTITFYLIYIPADPFFLSLCSDQCDNSLYDKLSGTKFIFLLGIAGLILRLKIIGNNFSSNRQVFLYKIWSIISSIGVIIIPTVGVIIKYYLSFHHL